MVQISNGLVRIACSRKTETVARSSRVWYLGGHDIGMAESVATARARTTTCTGGRLAAFICMANQSSVPRDVQRSWHEVRIVLVLSETVLVLVLVIEMGQS